MTLETRLMFEFKTDANRAKRLIKVVNDQDGFGYPDHGDAFLVDLNSFYYQFKLLADAIKDHLTGRGKPVAMRSDHYAGLLREFESEVWMIRNHETRIE